MKFSIIIFLTISSLFFIQPTQSTFPIPGVIEHVCRLTPHYHLCVLTLKSHAIARKITSNADVAAFAKITLEVIVKKIPVILATLQKVHEQCEQPEFKAALEGCINSYTKISLDILPKALGCVDKGDLEGVKQHALNTANLAASCQKKCNVFAASSLSAFANAGSTQTGSSSTGSGSTKTGSSSAGSINTGGSSSAGGSINTGGSSSAGGSINTGGSSSAGGGSSSAGGSINTGSSSAGSMNTGSSAAGSINTGSASAGSKKSGSGSASASSTNTGSGSASAGSTNTGSSSGSTNTGSASAGSTNTGSSSGSTNTGSASAVKPAVKAAAKAVADSNVYVQNMCAITVSIVTKVSASKQTTLS